MDGKVRPVREFRSRTSPGVKVVVWPSRNPDSPGDLSFKIEKRYKDKKTGEWRDSKAFFKREINSLVFLMQQVAAWIESDCKEPEETVLLDEEF